MKKIISIFIIAFLGYSCNSSRRAVNRDLSDLYRIDASVIHPEVQVYNNTDATTDIYFSINSPELLYSKQPNEEEMTARIRIAYTLQGSYEAKVAIDSGSISITDKYANGAEKIVNGKITVKAAFGSNYLLKLDFYDLNRNQQIERYIDIYKTNLMDAQNFIVRNKENGLPICRNYLDAKEEVSITYKRSPNAKLFVKRYNRDFPVASPPFSIIEPKPFAYKPDSTFILQLNDSGTVFVNLAKLGMYHFMLDTNQREGLALYRFHEGFPGIMRAEQMIYPLRYMTSKDEYEDMLNSKNKKLAVENFWINCAGGQDRAKEVIRKFYNRVKDANTFYSSYVEGWKTDRGMIYLIFGPPNLVYRATDAETWVYGEDGNLGSLSFNFNRVTNPFSNNDYYLQRSSVYKSNWYRAVDIWRQGRIYLQN